MFTSNIEKITESFSETEKDLWNIVSKRIDFDYASESYIDDLKTLIRNLVINVAPFYNRETYQENKTGFSAELNVKSISNEPTPIVNYIESAVIERDLIEYLKENTELGDRMKENPMLYWSLIPENSEDAELDGIETCTKIGQKASNYIYHRPIKELSEEIKAMTEKEFESKTRWTEKEQKITIRRLKAKQPASFSRHNWHYAVIDFVEWYCLKNKMPFYLTRDLYFSNDSKTIIDENDAVFDDDSEPLEKNRVIEGIGGRMLMHAGRYGIQNADETIQRYYDILEVLRNHKEFLREIENPTPIRRDFFKSVLEFISTLAADVTLLSEEENAECKGDRLLEILWEFAGNRGKKWFNNLYKEVAEVTGIKPSPVEENEEEDSKEEMEESSENLKINCYLSIYPIIGIKKAQETKDDVFTVLKDFNENDSKKFEKESNRKVLYNALKEAFAKHLDEDSAERATYCLFRSLMKDVDFPLSYENRKIRDEFEYRRALRTIKSRGFHPRELIQETEKKYADIIKGFGFDLNTIEINRTAEKIQRDTWTFKRVIDDNWTKDAHEVLADIIKDILKNAILPHQCIPLKHTAIDTIYQEVCKEFEITPMI